MNQDQAIEKLAGYGFGMDDIEQLLAQARQSRGRNITLMGGGHIRYDVVTNDLGPHGEWYVGR